MPELLALLRRRQAIQRNQLLGAAMVCAMLANVHRDPARSRAYSPEDFLPPDPEREAPSGEEPEPQIDIARQLDMLSSMGFGRIVEEPLIVLAKD